jgi:UDP-glucose 4-epimerase
MGMTKAIQERVFIRANLDCPNTRFICVRYGNVLASRGSVIPLFHEQIRQGGPVTITTKEMTRFFLSLAQAVDVIFAALKDARCGETFIPKVPSANMTDVARVLIGNLPVNIIFTGIRPGEKIHEILISEEEVHRTIDRDRYYSILPILPEVCQPDQKIVPLEREFSSADHVLKHDELKSLLEYHGLLSINHLELDGELLR